MVSCNTIKQLSSSASEICKVQCKSKLWQDEGICAKCASTRAVWSTGQLPHLYSQGSELSHATSCMFPHTAVVHWTQVLSLAVADLAETWESNPFSLDSRLNALCQESFTTEHILLLNIQDPMYITQYCTNPTCKTTKQWGRIMY